MPTCDLTDKCQGVKTFARDKSLMTNSNWCIQATRQFFKYLILKALRVIPILPHIPRGVRQVRSYLTNACKENNGSTGVMENLSRESHSIVQVFNRGSGEQLFHQLWPSSQTLSSLLQCAVGHCAQDILCSLHRFPNGPHSRKYRPVLRFP